MSESYPKIRLRPVQNPGLIYRPNAKEANEEQERLVYRQSNDDTVKYEDLLEKIEEEQQPAEQPMAHSAQRQNESLGARSPRPTEGGRNAQPPNQQPTAHSQQEALNS